MASIFYFRVSRLLLILVAILTLISFLRLGSPFLLGPSSSGSLAGTGIFSILDFAFFFAATLLAALAIAFILGGVAFSALFLLRAAVGSDAQDGPQYMHKLLAFLIATLIFSSGIQSGFRAVSEVLEGIVRNFILTVSELSFEVGQCSLSIAQSDRPLLYPQRVIIDGLPRYSPPVVAISPNSNTSAGVDCFLNTTLSFLRFIGDSVVGIFNVGSVETNLLTGTVAFLAIYALGARFAHLVSTSAPPRLRFWLAYGAIAVFAIFLSVSAIFAIALMTESRTVAIKTVDDLKTEIEAAIPELLSSGKYNPPAASPVVLPSSISSWPEAISAEYRSIVSELDSSERAFRERQTDLINELSSSLDAQVNFLLTNYELQSESRGGGREANSHFLSTLWNALRWARDYEQLADSCDTLIRSIDGLQVYVGKEGERLDELYLSAVSNEEKTSLAAQLIASIEDEVRFSSAGQDESSRCDFSSRSNDITVPSRADFGSSLGFAWNAAGWLLASESQQVALIVGLIGFGLLGALVSSFVRSTANTGQAVANSTDSDDTSALNVIEYSELASVVFVGFTAALVVFLASYGGLAVVATQGDDPNPYVVFFACLVGAVFSGTIWEKAKSLIAGDSTNQ